MKYLITIEDLHIVDGEKEESVLEITGSLRFNDSGFKIRYKENDESYGGCFVTLSVQSGRKVTMTRTGAFTAELIMEAGKRHICLYNSPAGEIRMGVFTSRVETDILSPAGGKLRFEYALDINGKHLSDNKLSVTIKPQEEI